MRLLLLPVVAAFSIELASAQSFENVTATMQGNIAIITYDLAHPVAEDGFTVTLYGSHNNYVTPIRLATGAIGPNQKAGAQKRIEWDVKRELSSFRGDIVFELRGLPELIKLNFKNPFTGARRGKSRTINWVGGTGQPNVKLEVLKDNVVVSSIGEKKNSGSFEWAVPSYMSKGKGYTLRISTPSESVVSTPFAVKAKIPLLLKLSPILIVPFLLPKGGSTGEEDLPLAPDPK
jgi:hypothetical protein